jgi:hypothetical protein
MILIFQVLRFPNNIDRVEDFTGDNKSNISGRSSHPDTTSEILHPDIVVWEP